MPQVDGTFQNRKPERAPLEQLGAPPPANRKLVTMLVASVAEHLRRQGAPTALVSGTYS